MICIIDYGAGNLKSIQNMLTHLSIDSFISHDASDILKAEKLILPGVGKFDHGMRGLQKYKLDEAIRKRSLEDGIPILGICLGAQLMGKSSEEGEMPGLSLLDFEVMSFDKSKMGNEKIPHMSWSEVKVERENELLRDFHESPRFYFVHAYHFLMKDDAQIIGSTHYGYSFTSAFRHKNIYGAQFHPEKSHRFGMQVLKNFANLSP